MTESAQQLEEGVTREDAEPPRLNARAPLRTVPVCCQWARCC